MTSQSSGQTFHVRAAITAFVSVGLVACSTPVYEGAQPTMKTRHPHTHLEEVERDRIETVVVMPHTPQSELTVFGTYDKDTISVTDGVLAASQIPLLIAIDASTSDLGTIVPPEILIPVIVLPSAIMGASAAKAAQEIQEFRDRLTEHLVNAASPPLENQVLASDIYSRMRRVSAIDTNVIADTTPLPEDTDVVLLVRYIDFLIDVQGNDAMIEVGASATLQRVSDGKVLWAREYFYEDRDTLSNWTRDELILWDNYINFARHFLARQITSELFEKYELRHNLYPLATDSVVLSRGDRWQGVGKSSNPTLAWKLVLMGEDTYAPWTNEISEANTFYDLEIYDNHRLIYSAKQIAEPRHEVTKPLDNCQELHWTVRPSYHIGGKIKYGEWMRYYTNVNLDEGYVGTKASEMPAFVRGFALLKTKCRRKT